ncbi:MAG: ACP S-malonyltransferase [Clostridiales bacterium]|nr:ACP S-malonyltransferase [Clostridiales bacterium]
MKIAIFFPGQGSQKAGMGREFYDNNEVFRTVFDACEQASGIDLKTACFDGVGLERTSITQPSLYAINIATYKMLESMGIAGDVYAGLSLGEYAALAAAGVLDVVSTTQLVAVRGALMENAVPPGVASMTAVIGLPKANIENAIADIDNVWIANLNSPEQIIIGGTLEALDIADVKIKEAGAKIVKRLNVSGPFHTPLLKEAGNQLRAELNHYEINPTDKMVYANVSGRTYQQEADARDVLSRQVSSAVQWVQIMDKIIKGDDMTGEIDVIIECGPGNVLSKLAKKHAKLLGKSNVAVFNANSIETIAIIKEHIKG